MVQCVPTLSFTVSAPATQPNKSCWSRILKEESIFRIWVMQSARIVWELFRWPHGPGLALGIVDRKWAECLRRVGYVDLTEYRGVSLMSHQLGQRGCGRSSVSNRLVLVAELAGDDLPYVRLFESLSKKSSDRKRKRTTGSELAHLQVQIQVLSLEKAHCETLLRCTPYDFLDNARWLWRSTRLL